MNYSLDLTLEQLVALTRFLVEQRNNSYVPSQLHEVISQCEDELDKAGLQLKRMF